MRTEGLVLRHLVSDADLEATCRLLATVFDPQVAALYETVVRHYPGLDRRWCLIAEDPNGAGAPTHRGSAPAATGSGETGPRVVASVTRLPTIWSLGGVDLPVASLNYVATHPDYRRLGLVRALVERFDEEARADGCLLAGVLGIEGFYDRFGYFYCSPVDKTVSLGAAETLKAVETDPWLDRGWVFTTRIAEAQDVEALAELWEAGDRELDLFEVRSRAFWEHVVRDQGPTGWGPCYVVSAGGRVAAMFVTRPWPNVVTLAFIRTGERDALLEMLRWAAVKAIESGYHRINLCAPIGSPLYALATSLGGREELPYAWQVKIYDHRALLERLAPVLERRLAASLFRGLSTDLVLDLYGPHLILKWRDGRLVEVVELSGRPAARLPRPAFARLVLGARTVDEIVREREDVGVTRVLRPLLDVLFPRLRAWMEE